MSIILKNSRLSFVAGQCFFEQEWRPGQGPDPIPWSYSYYRYTFNQLRGGKAVADFAFPWRPTQRSAFWSTYLGGQSLAGVGADSAWGAMVPFRLTNPLQPKVGTDSASERVFYDVYGYPHGIVAAMTIQSPRNGNESVDDWRDRTRRLRLDHPFTVTANGAPIQAKLSATEVLDAVLDWHRETYYGPITERYRSADPISIGVIIQGDGVDATVPIDADIHRALFAVTSWPMDWQTAVLPDLTEHCLSVSSKNRSTGDALYAARRGRTLWRPALFGLKNPGKAVHTLSCLGHNLLAGAVQAESLRLFAQGFAASPVAQKQFDSDHADIAAELLDRMRRGVKTYRSTSIQKIIEDSSSKAEVNALLSRSKDLAQIP